MQPEQPRTVTFNPSPIDEAQHRSARLGSLIIGGLVGLPALLCIFVAGIYNAVWAFSIGGSIPEKLTLTITSLALTGCVGGLPVASTLLAGSYPQLARQSTSIWTGAIWISAFSAFYFTATREWAVVGAPEPATKIAWIMAGLMDERQARAFFTLLFALAALAGGGLLLRLAVLASAESWRIGTGQAQWAPQQPENADITPPQSLQGVTSQTPEEIFGLWANRSLRLAEGHVQAQIAYDHYREACRLTGVNPVSLTKFGTLMTNRAATTEGRVTKTKINGNICYANWVLVGSEGDLPESGEARLPVEPPKGESPVIPLRRK